MLKSLAVLGLLVLSSVASAAIFGVDNREAIKPSSPHYQVARATAISVLSSLHKPAGPGAISLWVDELVNLCPTERFAKDPSLSYACSGFLVAPDLIVTAGHCMVNTGESRNETKNHCEAFSWLFDFNVDVNGQINTDNVPAANLYKCKQVVFAVKDERAPFRDYALVQLDRPVLGRTPLKLASAPIPAGSLLSMIGYPLGTPAKRSAPAAILRNNPAHQVLITSLDAMEGNSGSAVLNAKNEVVGILIGGTPSQGFVPARNRACEIYNKCSDVGTNCLLPDTDTSVFPGYQRVGSEVQRIAPVLELIKQLR